MAPILPSLPISPPFLKRPSPSSTGEGGIDEPSSKRQRLESISSQISLADEPFSFNITESPFFDDDPRQLLQRSIALALQHVGFDGASREALEAMCAEVEAYATHFLSNITVSMLHSRRAEPTPLDFGYALRKFDLPLSHLRPHLENPVPASKLAIHFELSPAAEPMTERDARMTNLLGYELSGESEKQERTYIPKTFIPFPSKHTYKWTEKESLRETDPRKIREEAAKAARHAEDSLRRLSKAGKAGKEKDIKLAASRDPRSKERHELWEKMMSGFMGKDHIGTAEEDQSMIVNSASQYFRKPLPKKTVTIVAPE